MGVAKVTLNGTTLIDTTGKTVTSSSMLSGITALDKKGDNVTGNISSKSSTDLTVSGATVTAPAGYYANAASKAVATTTHPNPTASIASSTGVVTATHAQTAGYVAAGTTTGTLNLTTKAAATYNTSTADQTIASNRWLTGAQTIKSVTTSNLTAANIKSGVTVKVGDANNASRITQVTGTLKEGKAYTATIVGNGGDSSRCYVQYNGTKYYTVEQTFTFYAGDTLNFYLNSEITNEVDFGAGIYYNGKGPYSYSYTAIGCNIILYMESSQQSSIISVAFIDENNEREHPNLKLDYSYGMDNSITPTSTTRYIEPHSSYYGLGGVSILGDSNLVSSNIKSGVSIFGVTGTHQGQGEFYNTYRSRTVSVGLNSTITEHIEWLNTLSYIKQAQFAGMNWQFMPNVTLPNVSSIAKYGFFQPYTTGWTGGQLSTINCPNCTTIGDAAFYSCGNLNSVNFPSCTSIGNGAFNNCNGLLSADFPVCTYIGSYAFEWCTSLTTINFPICSYIENSAFSNCRSLTAISFPACTHIGAGAFYGCSKLSSVDFPICTFIGGNAFSICKSLATINFPSCVSIGRSAFYYCSSLTTANFPSCISISSWAFYGCSKLVSISFPICTFIAGSVFYGCKSLTSVTLPACTSIEESAFAFCNNLTSATFPICTSIGQSAFTYCYSLISLYLTSVSSVPILGAGAFYITPIGGYSSSAGRYGSVFVPASLYSAFISATNWASISSRIVSV